MKILIVSDTHRRDANLVEVLKKEKPLDLLIHLGDVREAKIISVKLQNVRHISSAETMISSAIFQERKSLCLENTRY